MYDSGVDHLDSLDPTASLRNQRQHSLEEGSAGPEAKKCSEYSSKAETFPFAISPENKRPHKNIQNPALSFDSGPPPKNVGIGSFKSRPNIIDSQNFNMIVHTITLLLITWGAYCPSTTWTLPI